MQSITKNGVELKFFFCCKGMYSRDMLRAVNRELMVMCERNGIQLAMTQVVVNVPMEQPAKADAETKA